MLALCGPEEKDNEKVERMLKVALWCVHNISPRFAAAAPTRAGWALGPLTELA